MSKYNDENYLGVVIKMNYSSVKMNPSVQIALENLKVAIEKATTMPNQIELFRNLNELDWENKFKFMSRMKREEDEKLNKYKLLEEKKLNGEIIPIVYKTLQQKWTFEISTLEYEGKKFEYDDIFTNKGYLKSSFGKFYKENITTKEKFLNFMEALNIMIFDWEVDLINIDRTNLAVDTWGNLYLSYESPYIEEYFHHKNGVYVMNHKLCKLDDGYFIDSNLSNEKYLSKMSVISHRGGKSLSLNNYDKDGDKFIYRRIV